MASTFVLKRKTFADPQQQQDKSSLGKKLAIGAGAVAATAGAFYGARKGMFGNSLMRSSNNLYGRAGGWLQRQGATNMGNNMMNSAAKDYTKATTKALQNNAKQRGITLAEGQAQRGAENATFLKKQSWAQGTSVKEGIKAGTITKPTTLGGQGMLDLMRSSAKV